MLQALRRFWTGMFLLLLVPLAALAQEEKQPKGTAFKGGGPTSATGEAFKDLMGAWWLWLGIILILGLLGLLFYLRNKTED
jgi:hypothetical protein